MDNVILENRGVLNPIILLALVAILLYLQYYLAVKSRRYTAKLQSIHPLISRIIGWWMVFLHEISHAFAVVTTLNSLSHIHVTSSKGQVRWTYKSQKSRFTKWICELFVTSAPAIIIPGIFAISLIGYEYIDVQINTSQTQLSHWFDIMGSIIRTIFIVLMDFNPLKPTSMIIPLIMVISLSSSRPSSFVNGDDGTIGDMQMINGYLKNTKYSVGLFILFMVSFVYLYGNLPNMFKILYIILITIPVISIIASLLYTILVTLVTKMLNVRYKKKLGIMLIAIAYLLAMYDIGDSYAYLTNTVFLLVIWSYIHQFK